ncbi:MAG TPA: type II secretion system F family protein, partial [Planctomycetes bacterium]|nr:type II secretion system F family protein [Planctomycetota bacterium]
VLRQITQDVESGSSLSEAMEKHPKVFDLLYTNMVRAGEIGGVQDVILLRLAEFMARIQDIRSRVKGALFYPVVVMVLAFAVITVLLIFVIPTFAKIFARERMELPWITQAMMSASDEVKKWGWLVILAVGAVYLIHRILLARSEGYRLRRDRFLLKLPLLGDLQRKSLLARFARTFGTLIQSGVPHLEALEIVKGSLGNKEIQRAVEAIRASIREGEGLARPMQGSPVFDEIVVNMVDVGEETGELDRMLLKIADRYEKEVDQKIYVVFKVIEPVTIVFLAVIVGLIMLSLLLPMVQLVQRLGKGV